MAAKTITDSPPCFTVGRRAFGLKDTFESFHTKTRFEVEKRVKLGRYKAVEKTRVERKSANGLGKKKFA